MTRVRPAGSFAELRLNARPSFAAPPRARTVVVISIAARSAHPISFWQFTKYGIIVALVTVAIAWVYVWLRYFVVG